jgi:vesicle coat complex subunit
MCICWNIQAAATCYIELIVKESDNNVKLIVLDRLIALQQNPAHEKIIQVSAYKHWSFDYKFCELFPDTEANQITKQKSPKYNENIFKTLYITGPVTVENKTVFTSF